MRRGLRGLFCTAAWALLIVSGLFLWAAVDYCRSIPTLYSFFGAEALEENLKPQGVIVMIEAEHTCMTMRGVKKPGSRTVTFVTRGVFAEDEKLQNQFFELVRM